MKRGFLKIVVAGVAVIVIVAATAIGISVHKSRQQQAEVTKGVEVIRNMEAVDVGAVENRIRQMEEDELKSSEEYKNRPINVKYGRIRSFWEIHRQKHLSPIRYLMIWK